LLYTVSRGKKGIISYYGRGIKRNAQKTLQPGKVESPTQEERVAPPQKAGRSHSAHPRKFSKAKGERS
jgi:hypothetical protein